jgi:outer membrane immunogenic protein
MTPAKSVGTFMRIRLSSLAMVASVVSPIAAFGADLPAPSPQPSFYSPTPVSNWSGFYAGAFVGGSSGSFTTSQAVRATESNFGFTSGVLAGYSFQSGSLVYGVEGDIGSNSLDKAFGARPGLVGNEIDSVYEWHARARVGYDLGNFLPFITGGAAVDRIYQYQTFPNDFRGAASDRLGWTIGAGLDAKIALPVIGPTILRAEYLYEGMPESTYVLGGPRLRTSLGVNEVRVALITPLGTGWRPSPEVGPADFGGAYFGVLAGGAGQRITTRGLGVGDSFDASGGFGGVYAGRNYMFGNWMVGAEGATTFSDIQGSGAQPGALATHYKDYFDTDFRGRAGYAFGRFLPFVSAGVAWSDSEQTDLIAGNYRGALSDVSGLIGLGVDYMASDRVALRAEYVHSETFTNVNTHLDSETCCSQSRSGDSFRLGLAYFLH